MNISYIFKPSRFLLNKKLRELDNYVSGTVLDVGCGKKPLRGMFTNYLKYQTLEVDKKFKPDIVGSAYNIPLKNNSVDTIVCVQVFEHLIRPQDAINEFYRILKFGGYCIISAPFFNELHEEPIDYFRYTKYSLKKLSESNGFKIIKIKPTSGFFL